MSKYKELTDSYYYGRLIPKLRIAIREKHRKMAHSEGPLGRLNKLSKTVTALFKYERIELNFNRAHEARGYAERLITDAMRYGDCHRPTMEMADFWIKDKQVIHKLFKVLVPRYHNYTSSYTKLYHAPSVYPQWSIHRAILELKGNPYPHVIPERVPTYLQIQNILLNEARKEFSRRHSGEVDEEDANLDEGRPPSDDQLTKLAEQFKNLPIDENK